MIVSCVWVRGNVRFTADYVFKLRSMVRRALPRFHRFICFTDQPEALPGIESITIAPVSVAGWWSKLALFNPAHGLRGPGLYLDLDVLVVNDLSPIADIATLQEDPNRPYLALIPHAGTFEGRGGLRVVKRYNSSVMALHFGTTTRYWRDWSPAVAQRLWGDQDWIGEISPNLPTMPLEWFPRLSELAVDRDATEEVPWQPAAKVVLCKKPKNHEAATRWPWFERAWR